MINAGSLLVPRGLSCADQLIRRVTQSIGGRRIRRCATPLSARQRRVVDRLLSEYRRRARWRRLGGVGADGRDRVFPVKDAAIQNISSIHRGIRYGRIPIGGGCATPRVRLRTCYRRTAHSVGVPRYLPGKQIFGHVNSLRIVLRTEVSAKIASETNWRLGADSADRPASTALRNATDTSYCPADIFC